jgi:WD40 repeat protein
MGEWSGLFSNHSNELSSFQGPLLYVEEQMSRTSSLSLLLFITVFFFGVAPLEGTMSGMFKPNGEIVSSIRLPEGFLVGGMTFTPDSRYLVVYGAVKKEVEGKLTLQESFISFYNTTSRKWECTITLGERLGIFEVTFTPDGTYMAFTGWEAGTVAVYRRVSDSPLAWKPVCSFETERPRRTLGIAIWPDGSRVIYGKRSARREDPDVFEVIDLNTQKRKMLYPISVEEHKRDERSHTIENVRISRDGKKLLLLTTYSVQLWDADKLSLIKRSKLPDVPPYRSVHIHGDFSMDGQYIVLGALLAERKLPDAGQDAVVVLDAKTLEILRIFRVPDRHLRPAMTSDNKLVLVTLDTVADHGLTYVWHRESGKLLYKFEPIPAKDCCQQVLSPDDKWLAVYSIRDLTNIFLYDFARIRRQFVKE